MQKKRQKKKSDDQGVGGSGGGVKVWRLIVSFPEGIAKEIQAEAGYIGLGYQETVKTLVGEALQARRKQLCKSPTP